MSKIVKEVNYDFWPYGPSAVRLFANLIIMFNSIISFAVPRDLHLWGLQSQSIDHMNRFSIYSYDLYIHKYIIYPEHSLHSPKDING